MPEQNDAYVAPGLRSPFAKIDRGLGDLDGLGLSTPVVQQTVVGERGPSEPGDVDLMLWGSVIPDLEVSNWGREVWLEAGLDPLVPAQGIVQACATSLAATTHAAGQIRSGQIGLALCGGVESMSVVQAGLTKGASRALRRLGTAGSPGDALRALGGVSLSDIGLHVPAVEERTTGLSMGEHAEIMARDWEISREAQDEFAAASHHRAADAREEDFFRPLLVSHGTFDVDRDGIVRPDTSAETLAGLPPAFDRERGTLTAGNSTPLTDGAAACWVGSEDGLDRLPGRLPRARIVDWRQEAVDLRTEGLLMAPAIALPRMLAENGLSYADVELWEIHEAFAVQVLCTVRALESREWLRDRVGVTSELGAVPTDRINPNGGSIALGHPFAATGARILSQAVRELDRHPPGTLAVVSICAAGGLGHVALLEAV